MLVAFRYTNYLSTPAKCSNQKNTQIETTVNKAIIHNTGNWKVSWLLEYFPSRVLSSRNSLNSIIISICFTTFSTPTREPSKLLTNGVTHIKTSHHIIILISVIILLGSEKLCERGTQVHNLITTVDLFIFICQKLVTKVKRISKDGQKSLFLFGRYKVSRGSGSRRGKHNQHPILELLH